MIIFACFSPHPPILLPWVGSAKDREKVKKTIESLEKLGRELRKIKPDKIIISSPHPDWGFNVPLYFLLNSGLDNQDYQTPVTPFFEDNLLPIITTLDSPRQHFEWGKNLASKIKKLQLKIALIASGDMSHCLKEDGPYGFQPDGPKFDRTFVESLKKKDIETILKLDDLYPKAGECGLRSFSFILGILEGSKINWRPRILSYEGPFGVGYLVAKLDIRY